MKGESSKPRGLSSEQVNFIIAISAILISAASFYATYLQADAAEKQVRAMTMPLIKFEHGNYDTELDKQAIDFTILNAGVGPALLKTIEFNYAESRYASLQQFLQACCEQVYRDYLSRQKSAKGTTLGGGATITRTLINAILPGQSEYNFLYLLREDLSADFWEQLNKERWNLALKICFCSMLDECFIAESDNAITEVSACPASLN